MPFKTAKSINLHPGDTHYGALFKFPVTSSGTLNDGTLPYSTNIVSADVSAWNGDTEVSDLIYNSPTISGTDTVLVSLNYPSTTMSGVSGEVNMKLKFVLTLNDSSTVADCFDNVIVGPC